MSKVVDNFLKYIAFDTQSAEDAASVPSTEKQFALAKLLVEQLKALGVKDVSMSEHCYVYGTIPATAETDCPVVGFLAHMDTSPDFSDENTRPQLIQNYNGGDHQDRLYSRRRSGTRRGFLRRTRLGRRCGLYSGRRSLRRDGI